MSPQVMRRRRLDRDYTRAYWPKRKASPDYAARNYAATKSWRQRNPGKAAAHAAVHRAIKSGRLVRPNRCELCNTPGPVIAHHWSYAPEHRLDVDFICRRCHGIEGRKA